MEEKIKKYFEVRGCKVLSVDADETGATVWVRNSDKAINIIMNNLGYVPMWMGGKLFFCMD